MASRGERQREKLLKALIDIGKELSSTIELEELLSRILRISREVFRFENAIIRLLDPERGVLSTAAAYGYGEGAVEQELRFGEGVMGKVAETGEPILIADLGELPDYVQGICGARSELAVPLVAREKVIGVFNVESPAPGAFSEEDIDSLMIMAGQAAIAIENARLYEGARALSASHRELCQFNERILQSANLGIYTVDSALRITSWNRKMEEMSGVLEKGALGKKLFELFPVLEQEGFADRLRRAIRRGAPEKLRLAHRNSRGQIRIQKRRVSPLIDGGEATGVVVIVEDITEVKGLMEQIIQSEKLAEVGRLSAGIAHEVNNPLAVISYAAQLLMREEDSGPFASEMLERIESEVERLKVLTSGLLSFSRGSQSIKRGVDLCQVIEEVLRLIGYELSRRSIVIEKSYDGIFPVEADPNKLKQVFINLIMNASHVMTRGGTLTIATRPVAGAEVEVAIGDTGPGIPPEVKEHIFDPFFSTKKEGEGTGLGLYICKNIVTEHEGRLICDTEEGKGTTFRVILPVEQLPPE